LNLVPGHSLRAAFLFAVLLSFGSCGGGNGKPVDPGPVPTITPTAEPTPVAPTDPRLTKSCEKLKAGTESATCKKDVPTFQAELNAAIADLQAYKPGIFDGNRVLSSGQYVLGVIQNLDAAGICAYWDGEELALKNTDWFSDQYDILTSKSTVWNAYMTTCYPSVFPLPLPGLPGQQSDCKLAPSKEILCSKDPVSGSETINLVDAAIGNALSQHPEYFDFNDTAPASTFVKIVNWDGYIGAISKELQSKGLCTFYDGEEIMVKGSNTRSEHFDIVLSSMHIRRGNGIYMSSCYPAAF
jgi:hypothetical protein